MENLLIRPMRPEEAREVQKIGRRAFSAFEAIWVPKPKEALLAIYDGKIAGAILCKIMKSGGKTIGYVDYAFVAPEYQGQGIGKKLYKSAVQSLWDQGCDALTALVKDDNVGSWGLFEENGFSCAGLPQLAREFGIVGALKQYFTTPFFVGVGMDYYVAVKNRDFPSKKGDTAYQIPAYLLGNLLLMLAAFWSRGTAFLPFLGAYGTILAAGILAGFFGTRFSQRKWSFRLTNGGALITLWVNFWGGAFPLIGSWYPDRYENTAQCRRDMGITALAEWLLLAVLTFLCLTGDFSSPYLRYLGQISANLLLWRLIPLYPFESFGGNRVRRWNAGLYSVLWILTAILLAVGFWFR